MCHAGCSDTSSDLNAAQARQGDIDLLLLLSLLLLLQLLAGEPGSVEAVKVGDALLTAPITGG